MITKLGGTTVSNENDLVAAIAAHQPGDAGARSRSSAAPTPSELHRHARHAAARRPADAHSRSDSDRRSTDSDRLADSFRPGRYGGRRVNRLGAHLRRISRVGSGMRRAARRLVVQRLGVDDRDEHERGHVERQRRRGPRDGHGLDPQHGHELAAGLRRPAGQGAGRAAHERRAAARLRPHRGQPDAVHEQEGRAARRVAIKRSITFNTAEAYARFLDTFTNTTAAPVTIEVAFGGQLGYDTGTNQSAIASTSSGDTALTTGRQVGRRPTPRPRASARPRSTARARPSRARSTARATSCAIRSRTRTRRAATTPTTSATSTRSRSRRARRRRSSATS